MLNPSSLLGLLFPQRCPVCGKEAQSSHTLPLCGICWATIPHYAGPACRQCGLPTISHHTDLCQPCITDPPPFSLMRSYGIYDGVLKEAIHFLKFDGKRRLARPFAALLAELELPAADAIIPVPLHVNQLRKREFNQTALIGKHLARRLKIPLRIDILSKIRVTAAQTAVDRKKRLKNIHKAFAASSDAQGLKILLVDDVITTGATARECAHALRQAGAKEVCVVALARSMPKY